MYVTHLVLTSAANPAPTGADGQRIQDALWAHARNDLGLEHVRVRVKPGCIDLVLFLRSAVHGGVPEEHAVLAAMRTLPFLRAWQVAVAGNWGSGRDRTDPLADQRRSASVTALTAAVRPARPATAA